MSLGGRTAHFDQEVSGGSMGQLHADRHLAVIGAYSDGLCENSNLVLDLAYLYPNDEPERDRMDLQYYCLGEIFGALHLAPFDQNNPPRRVLDVGTGTGIWCIQMGDQYPTADI